VKEPRVGMDRPNINFSRLLLGAKARETVKIVNKEHLPFSFVFSQAHLEVAEGLPNLTISPMPGVVGPNSSFPVEVAFSPAEEKPYNFNVLCQVKRRAQPILLNVKGEGYKIHTKLLLDQPEREDRELHPGVREQLDFGSLQVQERRSFTLRLSSPSFQRDVAAAAKSGADDSERPNVSFNFIWQVRTSRGGIIPAPIVDAAPYLSISPMQGMATQEEETVITVEYSPNEAHILDGAVLKMLIPSGPGEPAYTLELSGRARRPNVEFSVSSHDFGPCFVKRSAATSAAEPTSPSHSNQPFERLELVVSNRDAFDCWLSTTFVRTIAVVVVAAEDGAMHKEVQKL